MKRPDVTTSAVAVITTVLMAASVGGAHAQVGAMLRGQVVDKQGQPLQNVVVDLEFKGAPGVRARKFTTKTNNRGFFAQVGLPDGGYRIIFSKDGYRSQGVEMTITLGDLSEIPPLTMEKVEKPAPAAAAPAAEGQGVAAHPPQQSAAAYIKEGFAKASDAIAAGKLEEAEAIYKGIAEKAPDLAATHQNLGYVYRLKKDWTAAEAAYQKALALEPQRSETHSALAGVYEAMGDSKKALDVLLKAAPAFEQDARFQFHLGIAHVNAGNVEPAEAALKRVEALDPANIEVQFYLGTLAVGRNDVKETVTRLERYVAGTGQSPPNLATAKAILQRVRK